MIDSPFYTTFNCLFFCRAYFEEKVEISMSQRRWKLYLWFDSVLRNTKNIGFKLDSIRFDLRVVINDGDRRKKDGINITNTGRIIIILIVNGDAFFLFYLLNPTNCLLLLGYLFRCCYYCCPQDCYLFFLPMSIHHRPPLTILLIQLLGIRPSWSVGL